MPSVPVCVVVCSVSSFGTLSRRDDWRETMGSEETAANLAIVVGQKIIQLMLGTKKIVHSLTQS